MEFNPPPSLDIPLFLPSKIAIKVIESWIKLLSRIHGIVIRAEIR
jgi:hypothetical protein